MIFHEQNVPLRMGRSGFLGRVWRVISGRPGLIQRELDAKGSAMSPALALRGDAPVLQLDETLRDRQAQTDSPETMAAVVIFLDESVEHPGNHLRRNADAGIADHFHLECFRILRRITCAHRNGATARGELDGVLEHVPKDLLQPHGIGPDRVSRRRGVEAEIDFALLNVAAEDIMRVAQGGVGVDRAQVEPQFAAGDASNVEEVVDELGLQRDALGNDVDIVPH